MSSLALGALAATSIWLTHILLVYVVEVLGYLFNHVLDAVARLGRDLGVVVDAMLLFELLSILQGYLALGPCFKFIIYICFISY